MLKGRGKQPLLSLMLQKDRTIIPFECLQRMNQAESPQFSQICRTDLGVVVEVCLEHVLDAERVRHVGEGVQGEWHHNGAPILLVMLTNPVLQKDNCPQVQETGFFTKECAKSC